MEHKKENRICQNCKNDFKIEEEDFHFYEKMQVPPPTFCPECRMIRRAMFRNMRSFYKRECALCSKSIINMYPAEDIAPVFCNECWRGDGWEGLNYGKQYDENKTFFYQFNELKKAVPRFALFKIGTLVNSEYTNGSVENKNCYLVYSALYNENCRYSENIDYSEWAFDNYQVKNLNWCYENVNSSKNYNSIFLDNSRNCVDSAFLYNCVNCTNCFMGSGLRNKQYVFYDKQLSREEYLKEVENKNLGKFSSITELKKEFLSLIEKSIHKYADILSSTNVSGNHITDTRNAQNCFSVSDGENIKDIIRVLGGKNSMDCYGGITPYENMYEALGCINDYFNKFTIFCEGCRNIEYSMMCDNSSNLFGCIGLKNKSYCILNTQYTKEEYENLILKIKKDMESNPYVSPNGIKYSYGEFFPLEFSTFGYNETVAYELRPKTKEMALSEGYPWKDSINREYKISKYNDDLPDDISEVGGK